VEATALVLAWQDVLVGKGYAVWDRPVGGA
jgi:hypothetical protein